MLRFEEGTVKNTMATTAISRLNRSTLSIDIILEMKDFIVPDGFLYLMKNKDITSNIVHGRNPAMSEIG